MGYFIGFPSELDVVEGVVNRLTDSDEYDRDDLETVRDQDIGVDIEVYAEKDDDIEVIERGTDGGQTYLVLDPQTDEARALLEGETPPALEPGSDYEDDTTGKPEDTFTQDDTMTDDYELEELDSVDTLHAGAKEHYENQDDYADLEADEAKALGTALYVEEIASGNRDDIDLDDVADYIADQDEFNFGAMVDYKHHLGDENDYEQFVDAANEVVNRASGLSEELEARGAIHEALHLETRAELDNAQEAFSGVAGALSGFQTESEWLNQASDLDAAQQREQEAQERFEGLEDEFSDL